MPSKFAGVPIEKAPGLNWQVWRPLLAAGYVYLDELEAVPMEDLLALVGGKRSLSKLATLLERTADFEMLTGKREIEVFEGDKPIGSVPMNDLRQIIALRGTARAFGYDDPALLRAELNKPGGRVTWQDVARYRLTNKLAEKKLLADRAEKRSQLDLPIKEGETKETRATGELSDADKALLEAQVDELMSEFKREFDTTLWLRADWEAVLALARDIVSLRSAQQARQDLHPAMLATAFAKNLTDVIDSLQGRIAKSRDELQISLKKRLERHETAEGYEIIQDAMAKSKALVRERGSSAMPGEHTDPHTNQRCPFSDTRLAVAVIHFPRHVLDQVVLMKCPGCGFTFEWQLVTAEMIDGYVEAQDFLPSSAPLGQFGNLA